MGTNSTNTTLAHSNKSIKLGLLSDSDTCKAFDEPLAETDRNDIDKVSKALVHAISGGVTNSNIVNSAANWYIDLLKRQCKVAWINIIGPVIEPGDPLPTGATEMNLCKVFRILRTVVLTIRKEEDVALSDLVDALYNEEKWRIVDDDRCLVELLAFTAFGWLSESLELQ